MSSDLCFTIFNYDTHQGCLSQVFASPQVSPFMRRALTGFAFICMVYSVIEMIVGLASLSTPDCAVGYGLSIAQFLAIMGSIAPALLIFTIFFNLILCTKQAPKNFALILGWILFCGFNIYGVWIIWLDEGAVCYVDSFLSFAKFCNVLNFAISFVTLALVQVIRYM